MCSFYDIFIYLLVVHPPPNLHHHLRLYAAHRPSTDWSHVRLASPRLHRLPTCLYAVYVTCTGAQGADIESRLRYVLAGGALKARIHVQAAYIGPKSFYLRTKGRPWQKQIRTVV